MAEEAKARKKLEEADKKSKGGGGFFGKIFGSGGSDEAADLYVQERDLVANHSDSETEEYLTCVENGCGISFEDRFSFEEHYQLAHSHQCSSCSKSFPSSFLLDIHSDETHCPFMKIAIEREPTGKHFRCLSEDCHERFPHVVERNSHSSIAHGISSFEVQLEKRKMARRQEKMENSFGNLKLNQNSNKKNVVPRQLQFGHDQEKSFSQRRVFANKK